MTCIDCGLSPSPEQHAVMLAQSITIGKRVANWWTCSRCWLKRGALTQDEVREQFEQRAEKAVR